MIRPLLLALALLAPAAAFAQAAPQTSPLPPAADAPQAATPPSVSGDAPAGGRYGRTNLSPELQTARRAMTQSCATDFTKFCADAQQGGGARMQCLRQHAAEVSDGCRDAMQAFRAARQGAAPPASPPQG